MGYFSCQSTDAIVHFVPSFSLLAVLLVGISPLF